MVKKSMFYILLARLHINHFCIVYIKICTYKNQFACILMWSSITVFIQIIDSYVPSPGYNLSYVSINCASNNRYVKSTMMLIIFFSFLMCLNFFFLFFHFFLWGGGEYRRTSKKDVHWRQAHCANDKTIRIMQRE